MKVVDLIRFHNFEKIGHFRVFQQILGFFFRIFTIFGNL